MSQDHAVLKQLLSSNAKWAEDVKRAEPDFFAESAKGQSPRILWIGCSDSRVPESVITGSRPGDIFVHRNIANLINPDDDNLLSVLDFAVNFVEVEHVILTGHSACGGAAACLSAAQRDPLEPTRTILERPPDAPLNVWLTPLTKFAISLGLSTTPIEEALPIVVEGNIKLQVENLSKTQTIIDAWGPDISKRRNVHIHGWIYDLATGRLRDLNVSRGPSPGGQFPDPGRS